MNGFKQENKRDSKKLGLADPLEIKVNANSTVMQFVINTDCNVGTITFSVRTRDALDTEPLVRPDGVTQVVVDLATTERTVVIDDGIAIEEIIGAVSGLGGGTFYQVIANSGEQ